MKSSTMWILLLPLLQMTILHHIPRTILLLAHRVGIVLERDPSAVKYIVIYQVNTRSQFLTGSFLSVYKCPFCNIRKSHQKKVLISIQKLCPRKYAIMVCTTFYWYMLSNQCQNLFMCFHLSIGIFNFAGSLWKEVILNYQQHKINQQERNLFLRF